MDKGQLNYLITKNPKVRRLFFGRKGITEESIFEQIFRGPFNKCKKSFELVPQLIIYIWIAFKLKDIPEVITMVNLIIFFLKS